MNRRRVCARKGHSLVVVMAVSFSVERRRRMRSLGARVVPTQAAVKGVGMLANARELARREDILAGISGGATVAGTLQLGATRPAGSWCPTSAGVASTRRRSPTSPPRSTTRHGRSRAAAPVRVPTRPYASTRARRCRPACSRADGQASRPVARHRRPHAQRSPPLARTSSVSVASR
jgi:threonine dehydratase